MLKPVAKLEICSSGSLIHHLECYVGFIKAVAGEPRLDLEPWLGELAGAL